MEDKRNLVTFLLRLNPVWLNGGYWDSSYISETFGIKRDDQKLKIVDTYEGEYEGNKMQLVDIEDEKGNLYKKLPAEAFLPYELDLKKKFDKFIPNY